MSYKRSAPAGLVAVGHQSISLSNSTAVGLNSTNTPCTAIWFSVETAAVRVRGDGTDPTLTTGVLFTTTSSPYYIEGINSSNWAFQRSTGTVTVELESFRRPGDPTA